MGFSIFSSVLSILPRVNGIAVNRQSWFMIIVNIGTQKRYLPLHKPLLCCYVKYWSFQKWNMTKTDVYRFLITNSDNFLGLRVNESLWVRELCLCLECNLLRYGSLVWTWDWESCQWVCKGFMLYSSKFLCT